MLVPSMSWKEMEQEFLSDKQNVLRKSHYIYAHGITRMIIKKKLTNYIYIMQYRSPNKNLWLMIYAIKNYKTMARIVCVCIFNDIHGINALYPISINNKSTEFGMSRIWTHCIKSYKSRLNLDIVEPLKVVEHLCKNLVMNREISLNYQADDSGMLYLPVTGGILLGNYDIQTNKTEIKTFISDDLLKSEQIQKAIQLRNLKKQDFPPFVWEKLRRKL